MTKHHTYRLRLARGFLQEARQDISLQRWRSVMNNAQLTVENAAKSVLTLVSPVGRTHQLAPLLRKTVQQGLFATRHHDQIERLAELAELLGPDMHIQTDYGDEMGGRTPWELFDQEDARQALAMAEEAILLAQKLAQALTEGGAP